MEIFDVFSMNGIENYPAAGEIILENVILKVSQTHFSKDFYPKGGGGGGQCPPSWLSRGGINFSRGQCPPLGGAVKYPGLRPWFYSHLLNRIMLRIVEAIIGLELCEQSCTERAAQCQEKIHASPLSGNKLHPPMICPHPPK